MNLDNRVIIVTGANTGIGWGLMKLLARRSDEPYLVLCSREESTGKFAASELIRKVPNIKNRLFTHALDICSDQSIEKFRNWIQVTFGQFDVLVNNAATMDYSENYKELEKDYKPDLQTARQVIGTNYFGTRKLTESLLPLMNSDGKIICVTSGHGEWSTQGSSLSNIYQKSIMTDLDLQEIYNRFETAVVNQRFEEDGICRSPYKISKGLLNAWCHHILAKQLMGNQQCYLVCPGHCSTDMGGECDRTAEEGADTIMFCLDKPFTRDERFHGKFFRNRRESDFFKSWESTRSTAHPSIKESAKSFGESLKDKASEAFESVKSTMKGMVSDKPTMTSTSKPTTFTPTTSTTTSTYTTSKM